MIERDYSKPKLKVYKLIGVVSIATSINIFNLLELFSVFPAPTHINNKGVLEGNINIALTQP
jgi:hypothetical protein